MKRATMILAAVALWGSCAGTALAGDDEDRIVGGVMGGLLGQPQQASDAAYLAKERDRLVSLLQGGQFVTTRQGEPVDRVVLGVPLTRAENVYTAKPVPPSRNE